MSDFSLFSLFTAGLACFAPLAAAYTKPTGDAPVGNPISQPGLNSVVPVGEGFTITWEPTTKGTVTLVLLKGPSSNAVPQYAIVEKTENDGEFVWTPKKDLAPSDPSTPAQGYGIQLIDDATGQYQYTTQFGISNPDYKAGSESSSSSSSSTSEEKATKTPGGYGKPSGTEAPYPTDKPVYTTKVVTELTTYCPEATHLTFGNKTYTVSSATTLTITDCPCTITHSASKPVGTAYSTGAFSPSKNVTMVAPTGYIPSTIKTSAAPATSAPSATYQGSPAQQTGAASNVAMSFFGLVAAAGVAVAAF